MLVVLVVVSLLACKQKKEYRDTSAYVAGCDEQGYKYAYGPTKHFPTSGEAETTVGSDGCRVMRVSPLASDSPYGYVEACCPK